MPGKIVMATKEDGAEILALYKMQLGREFCAWDDHYPSAETIAFDLSRDALFVMKEEGRIIATISLDQDEAVEALPCWSKELSPGGELSRLAVHPDYQNQGLALVMARFGMAEWKARGRKSLHYLVNKYNEKALRSYVKLGCKLVGACDLYEQDYLCYEIEL